jgi:hypothetical protein
MGPILLGRVEELPAIDGTTEAFNGSPEIGELQPFDGGFAVVPPAVSQRGHDAAHTVEDQRDDRVLGRRALNGKRKHVERCHHARGLLVDAQPEPRRLVHCGVDPVALILRQSH